MPRGCRAMTPCCMMPIKKLGPCTLGPAVQEQGFRGGVSHVEASQILNTLMLGGLGTGVGGIYMVRG